MATISNKNTTQQPMQALGRTGVQTVKFIPAPRVYIAAPLGTSPSSLPSTISNGATPAGFVDMGTVNGNVKINYLRKVKEITTGIDNYFRGAYGDSTTNTVQFSLSQFDDEVMENISGLAATIISTGVANYQTGQKDLQQLQLLLVIQNKFDGKEFQFYNPNAYLNFEFEESGDFLQMGCTGYFPYFTAPGLNAESIMSITVFSADTTTVVNNPPPSSGYGVDLWDSTPYPSGTSSAGYNLDQWSSAPYGA